MPQPAKDAAEAADHHTENGTLNNSQLSVSQISAASRKAKNCDRESVRKTSPIVGFVLPGVSARPASANEGIAMPRYHHDSTFGAGPRHRLDREHRARFRWLANAHRAAGRLTACALDVAEALLTHLSVDGRCDPSHAALARRSRTDARTVRRACVVLRRLGLIDWQRRLTRAGWRTEQTSNAYDLLPAVRSAACGGQSARGIRFSDESLNLASAPTTVEIAAARAALAEIAARRKSALNTRLASPAPGKSIMGATGNVAGR